MKTINYVTATTDKELSGILELQRTNLKDQLTDEELKSEGFVTVSHSLQLLKTMNDKCPHILAKYGEQVVGYTLCMHPDFKDQIEVLKPMFREIEKVIPQGESFMVMGQVCIAKPFRRQGVFRGMYEKMQADTRDKFSSIITEVDSRNQRSLSAHFAVGFRELCQYTSEGRLWHLITLIAN